MKNEIINLPGEIWKPVKGYVGLYEVSNLGRVRSLDRYVNTMGGKRMIKGQIMKPRIRNKYLSVNLAKEGIKRDHAVHRLVAEAFIPNQENKPHVNHIDFNIHNNRVDNLNWMTVEENLNWSGIFYKKVNQYDKNRVLIRQFPSIREAGRVTGIEPKNISACCNGRRSIAGGYFWEFVA